MVELDSLAELEAYLDGEGFFAAEGVVADVFLGYGLSAALRRTSGAVPAAARRLPDPARGGGPSRSRCVCDRRLGAQLGRRRLRRGDRRRAGRDRPRRRLPGEPRPAPL